MKNSTLILNADYNPITTVPLSAVHWHDAVRIIFLGRADVLSEYDLWVIRSPSRQMRMPSVIALKDYQRHNGKVQFSRYNVILRDNYRCQYCNNVFEFDDLTFDHVIPRREGGKTNWENIVSACIECNQQKGHNNRMKPINPPRKPSYWELSEKRKHFPITVPHESWKDFLGWKNDVTINEDAIINNVDEIDDSLPFLDISRL